MSCLDEEVGKSEISSRGRCRLVRRKGLGREGDG